MKHKHFLLVSKYQTMHGVLIMPTGEMTISRFKYQQGYIQTSD